MLKSGIRFSEIGELTFPQIQLIVRYYFEDRGEWIQIINSYLSSDSEGGKGSEESNKKASQLAKEKPGTNVEVIDIDNPIPDGMVLEVDN